MTPSVTVRAGGQRLVQRLRETWEYRELLVFLAWRDVSVRYKQTALGAAWAILQPVATMLIFTLFFGRLVKVPSDGLPYPLFAFCGLLPWQLFASALNSSANSLVTNESLITKVYFPRLVIPLSTVLASLLDALIAFVAFLALMFFYGIGPTLNLWALPGLVVLTVGAAIAVGVGLSALNVRYRDVRATLPLLTQLWMLSTPIIYPSSLVPEAWRILYGLNPLAGVVEGYRWALLGRGDAPGLLLLVSVGVVSLGIYASLSYFVRVERTFADVI